VGLIEDVQSFDQATRATVDRFRGSSPAGLIAAIIVGETGGGEAGRFSLASDVHLDETGWPSEPLYIAFKYDVDPCDKVGGIWLRCLCTGNDAMGLIEKQAKAEHPLLTSRNRDLWYCTILSYSVGKGALAHVLECVGKVYATWKLADPGLAVEKAIGKWARSTDLSLPAHRHHWGRQSPALIFHRLTGPKHASWLDAAAVIGPLDGPPGPVCPRQRPADAAPFPEEIVGIAKYLLFAGATDDELRAKARELRRYLNRRRRAANARRAPLIFRIRKWFERGAAISGRRTEVA
jgi:hypothetical protein